jgi:hypothetical protein
MQDRGLRSIGMTIVDKFRSNITVHQIFCSQTSGVDVTGNSRCTATRFAVPTIFRFAALLSAMTACYGAAPTRPIKVPVPDLMADAQMTVRTTSETTMEDVKRESRTCTETAPPVCSTQTYTVAEPVTRTTFRASYGGESISAGQFLTMTDPDYDAKLSRFDRLVTNCKRANIPRYIGIGSLLVAALLSKAESTVGIVTRRVGLIGGTSSYALGYIFLGGRDCVKAEELHRSINFAPLASQNEIEGAHNAQGIAELVEKFNSRMHAVGATRLHNEQDVSAATNSRTIEKSLAGLQASNSQLYDPETTLSKLSPAFAPVCQQYARRTCSVINLPDGTDRKALCETLVKRMNTEGNTPKADKLCTARVKKMDAEEEKERRKTGKTKGRMFSKAG